MVNKSPCMYCNKRKAGCHAECERYQKFSKARQEINKEKLIKTLSSGAWEKNRMKKYYAQKARDRKKIKEGKG